MDKELDDIMMLEQSYDFDIVTDSGVMVSGTMLSFNSYSRNKHRLPPNCAYCEDTTPQTINLTKLKGN